MNRSTFNKVAVFGGLGLAAFTGGVSPEIAAALSPAVLKVIEWLGGIAGNQVHELLSSSTKVPPPGHEEIFRNHHIRELLCLAIRAIVERTISEVHENVGSASPELHKALDTLPGKFALELDSADGALTGIAEFNVPDLLMRFAESNGRVKILEITDWELFLDSALPEIRSKERIELSHALHSQFGEALWNLVKRDAISDGQGHAAVELLYLSRILSAVESVRDGSAAPDTAVLEERIQGLIGILDRKQTEWFERHWLQAERNHEADMAGHKKTHWLLQLILKRITGGFDESSEFRADISQIVSSAPAELIGREDETQILVNAWEQTVREEPHRPRVLTFVGFGGEGKTALVATWAANMARQNWPGCKKVFAWSFHADNTDGEDMRSSDLFFAEALAFFGDSEMAYSNKSWYAKSQRLAQLAGAPGTLLFLDGLEAFQFSPASPTPGEFRDKAIAKLVRDIAANSRGLCIVTTRISLAGLKAFGPSFAPQHTLEGLSCESGTALLKKLGVTGLSDDFKKLVEDTHGHVLTLTVLGSFLRRAFSGNIKMRDRVQLAKADAKTSGGQALKAMEAYETWMDEDSDESRRQIALIRLLGLFDRAMPMGCLDALLASPVLVGLTDVLCGITREDVLFALNGLEEAKLIMVARDSLTHSILWLDTHAILHEYFAQKMRVASATSWVDAHRILFDYFCSIAPTTTVLEGSEFWAQMIMGTRENQSGQMPTLHDLIPLYRAIMHGCHAGLEQEALTQVFNVRIRRGKLGYSTNMLGAFSHELEALRCFFTAPWRSLVPAVSKMGRPSAASWSLEASLFNEVGWCLLALGRLEEAIEPLQVSMDLCVSDCNLIGAAVGAGNLVNVLLALGEIAAADAYAIIALNYTKLCTYRFEWTTSLLNYARVLNESGNYQEAKLAVNEALNSENGKQLEVSTALFHFADVFLSIAEVESWRSHLGLRTASPPEFLIKRCAIFRNIATSALDAARSFSGAPIRDSACCCLTLARLSIYEWLLSPHFNSSDSHQVMHVESLNWSNQAVADSRQANDATLIPSSLITRAWISCLEANMESGKADLDEALEIAVDCHMPLVQADIHLTRARLFATGCGINAEYPWTSPGDDLALAEHFVTKHGYHRRARELADAKEAILAGV